MRGDKALREQLAIFLGTQAHMSLADAVKGFPRKDMNVRPPNVPYTFWHLLEHIRIAQWDIIDFIRNPDYEELEWPRGYWPAKNAKATKKDWDETIARYQSDLKEMIALARNRGTTWKARIPHGTAQRIPREPIPIVNNTPTQTGG